MTCTINLEIGPKHKNRHHRQFGSTSKHGFVVQGTHYGHDRGKAALAVTAVAGRKWFVKVGNWSNEITIGNTGASWGREREVHDRG